MKTLLSIVVFLVQTTGFTRTPDPKGLEQALNAYKESLLKRDFNLLQPYLDESYGVLTYKRPQADKIIPQLLDQWPLLTKFEVTDTKYYEDRIVVSIDYEYEGPHLQFWSQTSSSKVTLTLANKFTDIEYFDTIMKGAVQKHH